MQKFSGCGAMEETELWKESLEGALRARARELIEQILAEEVEVALGAERGRRVAERMGYRHGGKPRRLALRSGVVELRVPRARLADRRGGEREWCSRLLPRYRRSSPEVEQAVVGLYLAGGNTRRIRTALTPLVSGAPLSKSAVSRLVGRLQGDYERWRQRDLSGDQVVYLYLDAIYPKVRSGGKVIALPVLVVLGVKSCGEKVLLALATGGAESGESWQMVLEELTARHVGRPRLVISDGATYGRSGALPQGTKAAEATHNAAIRIRRPQFRMLLHILESSTQSGDPRHATTWAAFIQRCQVHKRRNVVDYLPEEHRPAVKRN